MEGVSKNQDVTRRPQEESVKAGGWSMIARLFFALFIP